MLHNHTPVENMWPANLALLYCHTPTTKCGGGGYTGFALSRRSVGPSVRPSPILVHSLTPLLMEGFPSNLNDSFTSTKGCTEPMLPMCQLKVKVTVKGQILNKQILDIMSCPHPIPIEGFPLNLRILDSNSDASESLNGYYF